MAVYIIEGKIGAGKTYYAVYSVLKKYCRYDEVLGEYISSKPLALISNIDNLAIDHINVDAEIEKHTLSYVFTGSYVDNIRATLNCRSVVFIIDEAQKYFHRKFYDKDVFFFFQYSRHHGIDIYLITQDVDTLSRELRNLSEYYIHAVSRTHGNDFAFTYKFISNEEVIRRVNVKRDKAVFRAYRSFTLEELEKPKPVYRRYVVYFIIAGIMAFVLFKVFFSIMTPKSAVATAKAPIVAKSDDVTYTNESGQVIRRQGSVVSLISDASGQNSNTSVQNLNSFRPTTDSFDPPLTYAYVRSSCDAVLRFRGNTGKVEVFSCSGKQYRFNNGVLDRDSLLF